MGGGRYFLFDVPGGVGDRVIKHCLGDLINYPEGIFEASWFSEPEGIVSLQLDPKAKKLIKNRRDFLYVNGRHVLLVDKDELTTKTCSTIDDDVLQLFKDEATKAGDKSALGRLKKLKLTKFQHLEGHDCWRVEGSFFAIKKFEVAVRRVLFKGVDSPKSSTPKSSASSKPKAKKSRRKRRSSRIRPVDQSGSSDENETIRTGDLSDERENAQPTADSLPCLTPEDTREQL